VRKPSKPGVLIGFAGKTVLFEPPLDDAPPNWQPAATKTNRATKRARRNHAGRDGAGTNVVEPPLLPSERPTGLPPRRGMLDRLRTKRIRARRGYPDPADRRSPAALGDLRSGEWLGRETGHSSEVTRAKE